MAGHARLVRRACVTLLLLLVLSTQADAAKRGSWQSRAGDESVIQRVSNRCSNELLVNETAKLLGAFSVECDPPGSKAAAVGSSTTPLTRWAKLLRSSGSSGDVFVPVLVASAGGPTAQLLHDALAELGGGGRGGPAATSSLLGGGGGGGVGVMYRPLPAAKRYLEVRRIRVGKVVYVVDDPRMVASWAFDANVKEGTGGGARNDYGHHDGHHGHALRNNHREAHAIHNKTSPGIGAGGGGGGVGGVGVGGDLAVDPETAARSAARAAAHANLTRSKGPLVSSAPRGTAADVHALHTLGSLADPRRPCFGTGGFRPGDRSGTFSMMTAAGPRHVAACEEPFQIAAHVRGWSDGCAEFPILTVTRRNLTAALPALERFLNVPEGSLTGALKGGGAGAGAGGKNKRGGVKKGGGGGGGGGRGVALDALAAVSHAEDRRHSPWMDPADGLDRFERGLYAYNMKRLFKEGLKLQRSLAAAPAPRLSPHAAANVGGAAAGGGGGGGDGGAGAGGSAGEWWAKLVGRRIDVGRCRVVGTGAMAARTLGTNGGGGGLSLPSIDALVHAVFVSQSEDEDNTAGGAAAAASTRRSNQQKHVAAPVELCRGAAADNTLVYRLSRRHVELAVSRATGMGHDVCFHEAVAREAGGSLEGDYDFTAQPPPPPEGIYVFANATNTTNDEEENRATTVEGAAAVEAEAAEAEGAGAGEKTNTLTPAQDARWRQHLAVYNAFHRSALAGRSAEDTRYLVLKLPPVFDLRREAAAAAVSTINAGEGASVAGLAGGPGGAGHTKLRPPSGAPFNLLLSAGLLALLSNRVLLVDFSNAPRLKGRVVTPLPGVRLVYVDLTGCHQSIESCFDSTILTW
jgi:hypothetical protein